jgi:hypothetical protein
MPEDFDDQEKDHAKDTKTNIAVLNIFLSSGKLREN